MRLFSSNDRPRSPAAPDGASRRAPTLVVVGARSEAAAGAGNVAHEEPATTADVERAKVAYNLGTVAQAAGDETSAARRYGEALQWDPGMTPAMFNMAVMSTSSEPARAVALYRRIVAVQPSASTAFFNLGLLLIEEASTMTEGLAALACAIHLDGSLASRVPDGVIVPEFRVGTLFAPATSVNR